LLNPAAGVAVNPVTLAAQRFIDVVFESRTNADIDPTTINGDELTLSNVGGQTGLRDARLQAGAPIQIGKNTYRYFLIDSNTENTVPLFSGAEAVDANNSAIQGGTKTSTAVATPPASEFTITINAGSFADLNGVRNL